MNGIYPHNSDHCHCPECNKIRGQVREIVADVPQASPTPNFDAFRKRMAARKAHTTGYPPGFATGGFVGAVGESKMTPDLEWVTRYWKRTKEGLEMFTMTKLSLLFWRAARGPAAAYPDQSSRVHAALRELEREGMVELITLHSVPDSYTLTKKGHVFAKAVMELPQPVQPEPEWVMPNCAVKGLF